MNIERLKELKSVVEAKSCRIFIDDNGVEFVFEIKDKELMWALEECSELIDAAIARQSVTSAEVAEAISFMENELKILGSFESKYECFSKNNSIFKTILAALQAYQPKGESR